MSAVQILTYSQPVSFLADYVQLLMGSRKKFRKGQKIPSLAVHWKAATANPRTLENYRRVCCIGKQAQLPILYPQVLSLGMQLAILKHRTFPMSALGAIHQRNHVLQHRPIKDHEQLDLECFTGDKRVAKRGLEMDINTRAISNGAVVWEGISTYLFRGTLFGKRAGLPAIAAMPEMNPAETREWLVPPRAGLRYARVSGDYNPIHISSLLARLFKFPCAIAHGMWSAAVCATHVTQQEGVRYDVTFKGPVFLGSNVKMKIGPVEAGKRFDLFCEGNPRPCLKGWIRPVTGAENLLPPATNNQCKKG